jgi:hypothetical protein
MIKIEHDLRENKNFMKQRKRMKFFIFITRTIIFSLLIILLAKPYMEIQSVGRGTPEVTILIDNSSSMDVFDLEFLDNLIEDIKQKMPVRVRTIASANTLRSNLGEEIISYIEKDSNILLISDLQSTHGVTLKDAMSYSSLLNATISGIKLESNVKDASVWIEAESKTTSKKETEFYIHVNKLNIEEYNIEVSINDNIIYNARDTKSVIPLKHSFELGEHIIKARIIGEDYISENNVFYKTISVLPQPKILYVTRTNSKLPELFGEYYHITKTNTIPKDLSQYYAVVIDDMNINQITNINELSKYVEEGNGLFVIGGVNSFDRGGYKSSSFETLLPVTVGRGDKKQGDSNIVILIDMSGSLQDRMVLEGGVLVERKDSSPLDLIKALSIDIIETLNRGNRVGVIAFAIPDPEKRETSTFGAVRINNIERLGDVRTEIVDKISRIGVQGQTLYDVGFSGAYSMIRHETGSRNVILISDGGKHVYPPVKDRALNTVALMAQQGIRTYTVGIPDIGRDSDEDFLKKVAQAGRGLYFPAGHENRLKILFGEPDEKGQGDEMSLFIINPTHFITRDIELDANVFGFNQVVPKNLARILVSTDSGEPAITEWRYGLGKVIALTTFSGTSGLGQLLQGENSRVLTRSVNYLIGDPQRKEKFVVTIPDTYINELVNIKIISDEYPKADIEITKIKDNEYVGRMNPQEKGITTILNTKYAVNYPLEYQLIGMNPDADNLVEITGGRMFNSDKIKEIIEHITIESRRLKITKIYITWQILIIIIMIYLFEIGCRKIIENKKKL